MSQAMKYSIETKLSFQNNSSSFFLKNCEKILKYTVHKTTLKISFPSVMGLLLVIHPNIHFPFLS